ncbi:hypothetical protein [Streptomyces sp. NPDC048172]|uniref:hypothetical protein n=1 Tax=Streptomyces sp. NPDC048172 TaxID=3365505 RepID=UPI0037157C16
MTLLAAGALAAVPATAAVALPSAPAGSGGERVSDSRTAPSLVGTWAVRATGEDGSVNNTVIRFAKDGTLSNESGTGTWKKLGPGLFSYQLTEHIYDDSGALLMRIEIEQKGVLKSGNSFASAGSAETFDPSGTSLGTTKVRGQGTRQ